MSFIFGKKDVENIIQTINGSTDEILNLQMIKTFEFPINTINGYMKFNLLDFFDPNIYANVRPKSVRFTIKNYNVDKVKNVICYYIHTPIPDQLVDFNKISNFINRFEFNSNDLIIENNQPYLTYCQVDENEEVQSIDISQITNANLTPNNHPYLSFGALLFQLNRITSDPITLEITCDLSYTMKKY